MFTVRSSVTIITLLLLSIAGARKVEKTFITPLSFI